jgi:hypothetical protein
MGGPRSLSPWPLLSRNSELELPKEPRCPSIPVFEVTVEMAIDTSLVRAIVPVMLC